MPTDATSLITELETIGAEALDDVRACDSSSDLEDLRVRHLGKKSRLTQLMRRVKDVPPDERPRLGQVANRIKSDFQKALDDKREALQAGERDRRLHSEALDVTLPGRPAPQGRLHPLTAVLKEIDDIFTSLGFEIASGPDIEDEYHNFDALNFPPDHPAKDMHDTFYLKEGGLLRTHTSPVQIRTMQRHKPPLAIVAPGKVYRCDADVTHSPVFMQVEGFLIDRQVAFSDLKGVLSLFLRRFFGGRVQYRFRPSFFPFTEPSAEVDILWQRNDGAASWLEVLGAGMIHPNVLKAGGCDPREFSGFAFGMGVERFAMIKYGISNIRLFYENDLRFLRQF